MRKEHEVFDDFIRSKGLRHTPQREKVIDIFLSTEKHLSIDELYRLVRKKHPGIGYVTVYRTMKLLATCGLCEEIDLGGGISRFEHKYDHKHHDHLVCTRCGRFIEVMSPEIERLQERLVKKESFMPTSHKLEIFGICGECLSSSKKR